GGVRVVAFQASAVDGLQDLAAKLAGHRNHLNDILGFAAKVDQQGVTASPWSQVAVMETQPIWNRNRHAVILLCSKIGHSGRGCPLVSGANGKTARPIRKTVHSVTPA